MDIKLLCDKARERRNKAINAARAEYAATISHIRSLAKHLDIPTREAIKEPKGHKTVLELMTDLIPTDREFTVPELLAEMRAAQPGRRFNDESVRSFMIRLKEQGRIRRVRKSHGGVMVWASTAAKIDQDPWLAVSSFEAAEQLLRERGALNLTEIVVYLQQNGYRTDLTPKALRTTVGNAMRERPDRFRRGKDQKWSLR